MPETKTVKLTVVTANIGRKHASAANVKENIHKIRTSCPDALIGFQEIDEFDVSQEFKIVGARLGPEGYAFAGPGQLCPIAVPPTWKIKAHSISEACKGKAGHTPRRVIVTARCRPVNSPDFPPVIFMNGHFPFHTPDRWADCQRNWRRHVKKVHNKGVTIITTRDVNFHEEDLGPLPKLHDDERQVFDDGTEEWVACP